jgi:hypothetical protein
MSLRELREFRSELMAEVGAGSTFSSIVPVEQPGLGDPGPIGPYCY